MRIDPIAGYGLRQINAPFNLYKRTSTNYGGHVTHGYQNALGVICRRFDQPAPAIWRTLEGAQARCKEINEYMDKCGLTGNRWTVCTIGYNDIELIQKINVELQSFRRLLPDVLNVINREVP